MKQLIFLLFFGLVITLYIHSGGPPYISLVESIPENIKSNVSALQIGNTINVRATKNNWLQYSIKSLSNGYIIIYINSKYYNNEVNISQRLDDNSYNTISCCIYSSNNNDYFLGDSILFYANKESEYIISIKTDNNNNFGLFINYNEIQNYYASELDFTVTIASDNQTASIIGYNGPQTIQNMIIPDTIQGLSISEIGYGAFSRINNIFSIILPSSIRIIGDNAFENSSINTITLPDSVSTIGNRSFSDCYNLVEIVISNNVNNIGSYVFNGCKKLTEFKIPNNITNFGEAVFQNSGIKEITFSSKMTIIPKGTFRETPIKNIIIPEGITEIGEYSFFGCSYLENITLPSTLRNIGSNAFYDCIKLKKIIIPNKLSKINTSAFQGCGLLEINIPTGITEIGQYAFADNTNLKSVTLPSTIRIIGSNAFAGCIELNEINIPENVTSISFGYNSFIGCYKFPLLLQAKLRRLGFTDNFDTQ